MGSWGTGLFENDYAMDWAYELLETGDAELPASILWGFDGAESLDEKESAEALAAAEAIAASVRQPAVGLPDQVRVWVERTGSRADAEEVQLALRVVGVILDQNAELRDQQDETGDSLEKWLTPIDDLRRRLSRAEPAPAGTAEPSASRRLRDLVAGRGSSGSRLRDGGPGAECEWRKMEGGVLFSLRDARGLAVTLHTGYGGQPRGLPFPAGLWLHAPLYIWGDAAGTWPRGGHKTCPVYDDPYHWDNVAETGRSVDLVNRWVAAGGDDDVVWAELDREHDVLTRKYEAFLTGKRELVVAGLKERGRDQDAEKFAGYDPPKAEAWLVDWEKKRLTADLERGKTLARLWREGLEESNRRFPSGPGPGQPLPAR
jgi:hypothetical protein